jgi:hypothetical protein
MATTANTKPSVEEVRQQLADQYEERAATTPDPDSVQVEMIGDATILRQSPILSQFEDLNVHTHEERSDFGRDGKVTGTIVDSGKDVKCYYTRATAWVDAETGKPVAAYALHAKVFRLSEQEILRDFFHEMAHCRCALAFMLGEDKSPDTTVNGKHSSKLFKLTALDYFTNESFITKDEVEKDTKTLAKKENREKYGQTDINTIRKIGFEFQPWLIARLATFNNGNGFDMSVFNVYRVMDEETPRNGTKTIAVGCEEHHWDVDSEDRELYNARIRTDAQMPACSHEDHYEDFDNFVIPLYVEEPESKD